MTPGPAPMSHEAEAAVDAFIEKLLDQAQVIEITVGGRQFLVMKLLETTGKPSQPRATVSGGMSAANQPLLPVSWSKR